MSIEFNRRTFLKTSAALVGATALVGLTGCGDSSSSSSIPAISKKVDLTNNAYKLGDSLEITVDFAPATDAPLTTVTPNFSISNKSSSLITLYSDSFSAYYKGKALRLLSVDEPASSQLDSIDIDANMFAPISPVFSAPTIPAGSSFNLDDVVFKFHYNNKSIKFQTKNNGADVYTSGVYNDKVKV